MGGFTFNNKHAWHPAFPAALTHAISHIVGLAACFANDREEAPFAVMTRTGSCLKLLPLSLQFHIYIGICPTGPRYLQVLHGQYNISKQPLNALCEL